jgi:hypothetical protein
VKSREYWWERLPSLTFYNTTLTQSRKARYFVTWERLEEEINIEIVMKKNSLVHFPFIYLIELCQLHCPVT